MKLIDFLITESKKGWEWPDSIVKATSTKGGRGVNFYFDYACPPSLSNTLIAPTPFSSSELVTREKYEAALAASKRDEAIESIKAMLMYDYGDDPRLNDAVILYDAIAAGKIPHIRID